MLKQVRVAALAVALALWAGGAAAQQAVDGATTNPVGQKIGGWYRADSTFRLFKVDDLGRLEFVDGDRDRDFATPINLFNSVTLGVTTGHYQMGQAVSIQQFSRAALNLRYSHAAETDTDSVFVAVRVWGRMAEQTGSMHYWSPVTGVSVSDTCFSTHAIADSAGAGTKCAPTPPSFILVRPKNARVAASFGGQTVVPMSILGGTAATRGQLRKYDTRTVRWAGPYGTTLNLVDNNGAPCPFEYIWLEVFNLGWTRALNNVTCDAVLKVN